MSKSHLPGGYVPPVVNITYSNTTRYPALLAPPTTQFLETTNTTINLTRENITSGVITIDLPHSHGVGATYTVGSTYAPNPTRENITFLTNKQDIRVGNRYVLEEIDQLKAEIEELKQMLLLKSVEAENNYEVD